MSDTGGAPINKTGEVISTAEDQLTGAQVNNSSDMDISDDFMLDDLSLPIGESQEDSVDKDLTLLRKQLASVISSFKIARLARDDEEADK